MKRYEIWELYIDAKSIKSWRRIKSYPFKLQALIWCVLNGFVSVGRGQYFLHPNIKIKEVINDE